MIWKAGRSVYFKYLNRHLKEQALHIRTGISYENNNTEDNARSKGYLKAPQELTLWQD